jgi:hypothetical protein
LGETKATQPEVVKSLRAVAYPNPTNGIFTVALSGTSGSTLLKVEIYSMSGLRVLSQDLPGERKHVFSVDGLNSGIYIIHVTTDNGLETVKLIKL